MKLQELIETLQQINAANPNAEVMFDMVDEQDREDYDDPMIHNGTLERAWGETDKDGAWCYLRIRPKNPMGSHRA